MIYGLKRPERKSVYVDLLAELWLQEHSPIQEIDSNSTESTASQESVRNWKFSPNSIDFAQNL
jgi:hypothetical protein